MWIFSGIAHYIERILLDRFEGFLVSIPPHDRNSETTFKATDDYTEDGRQDAI